MVLAVLWHRELVPAIWLPDPRIREERELARFRLHLVKHKSALKCRVHSTLINFAKALPGHRPLESRAQSCSHGSRSRSPGARTSHHPCIPLLMSAPGSAGVLSGDHLDW